MQGPNDTPDPLFQQIALPAIEAHGHLDRQRRFPSAWGLPRQAFIAIGKPAGEVTREDALAAYEAHLWTARNLPAVAARCPALALVLFEAAIFVRDENALMFTQQAFNALVVPEEPLRIDGHIGPVTIAALEQVAPERLERVAVAVRALVTAWLLELVRQDRGADVAELEAWIDCA